MLITKEGVCDFFTEVDSNSKLNDNIHIELDEDEFALLWALMMGASGGSEAALMMDRYKYKLSKMAAGFDESWTEIKQNGVK